MIHYIEYDPETGEGHGIDPFNRPDLVAVVRCRDCKRVEYCKFFSSKPDKPDGFCAWASRRES